MLVGDKHDVVGGDSFLIGLLTFGIGLVNFGPRWKNKYKWIVAEVLNGMLEFR